MMAKLWFYSEAGRKPLVDSDENSDILRLGFEKSPSSRCIKNRLGEAGK